MSRKKGNKKELVITAARKSFERYGYKRTVIDDVVREAGIAKGTFYLYFKSKEDLFLEVLQAIRQKIMEEYWEAISHKNTAAEKIAETLRFSLVALKKHPLFAKITNRDEEFRIALSVIDDPEQADETEQTLKLFRALFEAGIAEGTLRPDLDLDLVPVVFGMFKLMHFFEDVAESVGITHEKYIEAIVDIAVNGILKPSK